MRKIFFCFTFLCAFTEVFGQKIAVKTNLLYDITSTLNIGMEVKLSPILTIDVSGNYNPFTFNDTKKLKHWLIQPELRYWFCEVFNGHYVSIHSLTGEFNVSDMNLLVYPSFKGNRYQGKLYGTGLGSGYQIIIGKRWNLELGIGLGWIRALYDKYDCPKCGKWLSSDKKNYFGITKAGISLVYIIK